MVRESPSVRRSIVPAMLAWFALAVALAGCAQVGPRSISANRAAYNLAVQQTNDQELLLNLVRMRYRDTLYFTHVERIAATVQFSRSVGASATASNTDNTFAIPNPVGAPISDAALRSLTVGQLGMSLSETPTVYYTPIEGEKFVRQMMTPMHPDLLFMLVKGGWPIDRVFAIAVQQMNGLRNFSGGSVRTGRVADSLTRFREAIALMRQLASDHQIDLGRAEGKEGGVELRFVGDSADTPAAMRLKALLGLAPDRDRFRLVAGGGEEHGRGTISILPRPMLGAMNFLAQGVEAPEAHVTARKVAQFRGAPGSGDAQSEITGGLFRIRVSGTEPDSASVVLFYRDHYYYLADDDLESKATFLLLTQLISLHAAPATATPGVGLMIGR